MTWRESLMAAQTALADAAGRPRDWLIADQARLAARLRFEPLAAASVRTIAGLDAHYEAGLARGAVALMTADGSAKPQAFTADGAPGESYEYGFLAYRELPVMIAALSRLSAAPDVIFYDGNGALHPRGIGAASHLGALLDVPVIGVSKNVAAFRPFPETRRGDIRPLGDSPGVGALLVTRDGVNPVCVSPGHRCDLDSAIALTLAMSTTRIPEPTRLADQAARRGRLSEQSPQT